MPKISVRDFSRTASALRSAAQALDLFIKDGIIDPKRAASIAQDLLRQLDLESDADQEKSRSDKVQIIQPQPQLPVSTSVGDTKGQNGPNGSKPVNSKLQSVPTKRVKK